MAEKCVVIGNGCAAAECVKAARESGYKGEMYVLSRDSLPTFNPMLITYFASGKIGYDGLFPYGGLDFYDKYDARRLPGSPVTGIDTERRTVTAADGTVTGYDKCVIATGASPVLPGAFSSVRDSVHTLRTADDATRFKEALGSGRKRALVAGASMIGVKAVEALVDAGHDVLLTDPATGIFPLAAHENCSEMIHGILEGKGVRLLFGRAAERVEKGGGGFRVFFPGRAAQEEVDHIFVCAGTSPNISFVDPSQIKAERGILVNEYMETGAGGVYAAGDAAQAPGPGGAVAQALGLWSNARLQGRTAGRNIAGKREKFPGMAPHNITHFWDHDFVGIGDVKDEGDAYEDIDRANGRYLRLAFKGSRLTGVNLLNIPEISGILKYRLTKGLLDGGGPDGPDDASLAMGRLFEKYPGIEKTFAEKR